MKVGVLGTGFGAYHVQLLSSMKDVDTIYVFGRNPDKLKDLQEKYGIHPVTKIDEIMDNDEIDLVDVCLPSDLHRTYAIQALEHKKHVLCETPVAFELSDAIAMQEAQQKYGKQLMIDLFIRFEHAYQILAGYVKSGKYGNLKKLQIQRNTAHIWGDLGPHSIVTSLMCHDIDFVSYLMGKPEKVQAAKALGKEGECAVSLLCSYDHAYAEINASSMMPIGYPFSVSYDAFFEDASVRYYEDSFRDHTDTKLTLYTANSSQDITPHNNCYYEVIRYAVQMAQSTEKPINDISEAIASLELSLKIQDLVR